METIQAKWYTPVTEERQIDNFVVHSMQAPNKPDTAEAVGRFFQNLPADRKASAHVGGDLNSRCRYVRDNDVAYGAPGLNHNGLHLELAGYAAYDRGQWTQPEMMAMLQQGALQIREWHAAYPHVPLVYVDAAGLKRGERGVTTHNEIRLAFGQTDHTDPGPQFPINTLLAMATATIDTISDEEEAVLPPYFQVNDPNGDGYWWVKRADGGVFAEDGAPFFGSLPGKVQLQAPVVGMTPWEENGITTGYLLVGADGGMFAFGAAPFTDSYAGHPEWHLGERTFTGAVQRDPGYVICSYVNGSDPPEKQEYDLTVKR